jgi:enamine deaminase RidA (YjgF/YER057c/UK114 family)
VFGARGEHARWAVGMSSLPFNMCLEVDLIALVEA